MGIIGAILGDIAGSKYEMNPHISLIDNNNYELFDDKCYFTDDTVLSIATMDAINQLIGHRKHSFEKKYVMYGKKYPDSGYGGMFKAWVFADEQLYDSEIEQKLHPNGVLKERKPYNSYGNGSAMRVSYIGQYYKKCPFSYFVKKWAKKSAKVTHNHPEGIKGAVTIAMCVWMAERGKSKEEILKYAVSQYPSSEYKFGCDLPFDSYKKDITFDASCMNTVPIAIRLFYENNDFEKMCKIINGVPCDTDTICSMAGAIFESYYYHCTDDDRKIIAMYLDDFLYDKMLQYDIV